MISRRAIDFLASADSGAILSAVVAAILVVILLFTDAQCNQQEASAVSGFKLTTVKTDSL